MVPAWCRQCTRSLRQGVRTRLSQRLMVHLWSSLAARDIRLMAHALGRFPDKPENTAWATYTRGHDNIGWAVTDEDTVPVGLDAGAHRAS